MKLILKRKTDRKYCESNEYRIEINLGYDEYFARKTNQREYWSLTANTYGKFDRDIAGGALSGKEIVTITKDLDSKEYELIMLVGKLHLSTVHDGKPMYTLENGLYFLTNQNEQYTIDTVIKHFRCTKKQAEYMIKEVNSIFDFDNLIKAKKLIWLDEYLKTSGLYDQYHKESLRAQELLKLVNWSK